MKDAEKLTNSIHAVKFGNGSRKIKIHACS